MTIQNDKLLATLLSGKAPKKYEGKQVVVCAGQAYILPPNDRKAKKFLNRLITQNPGATPTITFVPKHGTYCSGTPWPPTSFGAI